MKPRNPRMIRMLPAVLATSAALATGALLAPGTAVADPASAAGPLLQTTCSFDQIDAALHDRAPQVANNLDANPDRKDMLRQFFALPVDQRQAALDAYLAANPDLQAQRDQLRSGPYADQIAAKAAEIADTCHSY
ncbi:hemophore-related protein [Antrihabitans spumae]|uniref:Hemophore-related protein n=1 Tax=Antrihabitans spumae TaxID=3373370 RepID=A0ABW7KEM1_9NOCA